VLGEEQAEFIEVLAQGALALAPILFATLLVLFGLAHRASKETEAGSLRSTITATYVVTVASLALVVSGLIAVRYLTVLPYEITILATIVTLGGMFCVATFVVVNTFRK